MADPANTMAESDAAPPTLSTPQAVGILDVPPAHRVDAVAQTFERGLLVAIERNTA